MLLRCRDRSLSLDVPVVMGILNVTPDSFSDGGRHYERLTAIATGLRMLEEGAQRALCVPCVVRATPEGAHELPRGEARALEQRARFVGEHAEALSLSRGIHFLNSRLRRAEGRRSRP